jgi:hypothetical protein
MAAAVVAVAMSDLASLLRDIPGVSDIELDLVSGAVRVRLDTGANYQQVGERVREVLAESGLRSRLVPPRKDPASPPGPAPSTPPPIEHAEPGGFARVDWVEVREGSDAVTVVVSVNGRLAHCRARPNRDGVNDAIAEAVLAALNTAPARVLEVTEHPGGGFRAVTVLLEKADGTAAVGAAIVGVGSELAVARAVLAAVTG